jgi:hypothetical protein
MTGRSTDELPHSGNAEELQLASASADDRLTAPAGSPSEALASPRFEASTITTEE